VKVRASLLAGLLGAALAVSACGSETPAAATVNGKRIDRSSFNRELKALRDNKGLQAAGEGLTGSGRETVSAELTAGWLTALVYDSLITAEFDKRKLKLGKDDLESAEAQLGTQFGNPTVAKDFPDWFRRLLIRRNARAVALREAIAGFGLSDADVQKYFETHQADFTNVCTAHVLVKNKEEADAVVARLRGGEDFAAVAKDRSQDPGSAQEGGDLGCVAANLFVPEFEQAVKTLPLGEVSDPVQTQFGFHIIKVRDRPATTFEEGREGAKNALNAESQDAFRTFLDKAARSAKVTVDPRFGKFEAQPGRAPEVVAPEVPAPPDGRTETPGEPAPSGGVDEGIPSAPEAPSAPPGRSAPSSGQPPAGGSTTPSSGPGG
jgi:parvulin-like peptidyl-prolyl isomerase